MSNHHAEGRGRPPGPSQGHRGRANWSPSSASAATRVVANSRSIKALRRPPAYFTVQGDIGDPGVAAEVISQGLREFRPDRHPGEQRGHLHRQAVHRLPTAEDYANMVAVNLTGFYAITQRAVAQDAGAGQRARRQQSPPSLVNHANSKRALPCWPR